MCKTRGLKDMGLVTVQFVQGPADGHMKRLWVGDLEPTVSVCVNGRVDWYELSPDRLYHHLGFITRSGFGGSLARRHK